MTAMQTLISQLQNEISELEKKIEKCSDNKNVYIGHKYGLNHALEIAESLLEMEKEQNIEFANWLNKLTPSQRVSWFVYYGQ